MRFSRKLQKLLSPDLFASAFEHLSRRTHPVNRRPILDTLDPAGRSDLVTAHRICFHRIGRVRDGVEWSPADWEFFINDIRTRLLNENGRLLLDFNPRPDGSSFFTPELRTFFLSQGARIFRSKALLGGNANKKPRFKQRSDK